MPVTRQDCRNGLLELRLPKSVLEIFDGQLPHPALAYRCQSPWHIFSSPIDLVGGDIIPLWECGGSVTAYQHSQPRGRFIGFSLEHPEDVTVFGSSFQSASAALLVGLWEDEKSDRELEEVARLLDFRHLDRLLRECESRPRSECSLDYHTWRTRFLDSCEGTA